MRLCTYRERERERERERKKERKIRRREEEGEEEETDKSVRGKREKRLTGNRPVTAASDNRAKSLGVVGKYRERTPATECNHRNG